MNGRHLLLSTIACFALASAVAAAVPADRDKFEKTFDASISSQDQLGWLKEMSSAPNHVGSPHDKANAEFILARFKEWGWDAHIETFHVLYPTPISTTIEMVAPEQVTLGGQEPALAEDPTSSNLAGAIPPYVAYHGDGDVTAVLV
jgi:N-acetylated-alpha-linked acidic dipeptidase